MLGPEEHKLAQDARVEDLVLKSISSCPEDPFMHSRYSSKATRVWLIMPTSQEIIAQPFEPSIGA